MAIADPKTKTLVEYKSHSGPEFGKSFTGLKKTEIYTSDDYKDLGSKFVTNKMLKKI